MNIKGSKFSKKYVIIILCSTILPPFLLYSYQYYQFRDLRNSNGSTKIRMGEIQKGNSKIDVFAYEGDILRPNTQYALFDLVPISCIIDPIKISQNVILWHSNFLLKNALERVTEDPEILKKIHEELILKMTENKGLYDLFTNTKSARKLEDYELGKENHPYILKIPEYSKFYRESKISYLAALPIFTTEKYSNKDRHEKLKYNINTSIRRIFSDLFDPRFSDIRSIGFAAFAGTEKRQDSFLYLDYRSSYLEIYKAILDSEISRNIDKIYFVVYNKLPFNERRSAHTGLMYVYYIIQMNKYGKYVIIIFIFGAFLLCYKNIKDNYQTHMRYLDNELEEREDNSYLSVVRYLISFSGIGSFATLWVFYESIMKEGLYIFGLSIMLLGIVISLILYIVHITYWKENQMYGNY